MKTFIQKPADVERKWWLIDAKDQTVGRIATHIANILRGKNKATFTPNVDCGDFVVVINSDKLKLSGSKLTDKKYYRHSRFFGSLKEKTAEQMLGDDSTFIVTEAVRGMLPTNKLSRQILKKLKVYTGPEHDLQAQKPEPLTIKH